MKTGISLPAKVPEAAKLLLGQHRDVWTQFRCDAFTDWVREYREIVDAVCPKALLGTFHAQRETPWLRFDSPYTHHFAPTAFIA